MSFWIQYPKLLFDEAKHEYVWLGIKKRGVTSVLSSVGVRKGEYWKPVGFDDAFLHGDTTAADFGHAFHKIAAIILRGGIPQFPEAMTPWVEQFNRFLREWNIVPLCDKQGTPMVEYPTYSTRMDVAGTMDLMAFFGDKGRLAVFDWKSATSQQDHWRAQTACYAAMAKEVFRITQKIYHITIRFTETNFYPDIRDNHPEDLILFNSCNNILRFAA